MNQIIKVYNDVEQIPHANELVKFSAQYFIDKGLTGFELVGKLHFVSETAGCPSLNHALGCLDIDIYEKYILDPINAIKTMRTAMRSV
jgi:hypothetical protein